MTAWQKATWALFCLGLSLAACSSSEPAGNSSGVGGAPDSVQGGGEGLGGNSAGAGGTPDLMQGDGGGPDGDSAGAGGQSMGTGGSLGVGEIPARDYQCTAQLVPGSDVMEEVFTDSHGNSNVVRFRVPEGVSSPLGVLGYFHGNSPSGSVFDPPFEAEQYGLLGIAGISAGSEDSDVMAWQVNDDHWLYELLISGINGCVEDIDLSRVFLAGGSQGSCFLNSFIQRYWSEFQGGILSECGCFDVAALPSDVNLDAWRARWKIYIQSSTGDHLYNDGLQSYEYFKYQLGLNVVGDLAATGGHCSGGLVPRSDVLNWMIQDAPLDDPTPPATQYWRYAPSPLSFDYEPTYLAARGERVVRLMSRVNIPVADEQGLLREWRRYGASVEYRDWVESEFGLSHCLYESEDSGETWREVTCELPQGRQIAILPGGSVLVPTESGLLSVSTMGDVEVMHFDGERTFVVQTDDQGRIYAQAGSGLWRRNADGTWTQFATNGELLSESAGVVMWRDGLDIYWSQDAGQTANLMALPTSLVITASYGETVYAIGQDQIWHSSDLGVTWSPAYEMDFAYPFVTENGDLIAGDRSLGGHRTQDGGATWSRETAFLDLIGATVVHLGEGRMMASAKQGMIRNFDPN